MQTQYNFTYQGSRSNKAATEVVFASWSRQDFKNSMLPMKDAKESLQKICSDFKKLIAVWHVNGYTAVSKH